MDEEYDPLSHLSTALSLLPRTLSGIGFSLPVSLSEVDQMKAFFDHMHGVLQKDPKSGNKSLEKSPGPNPNTIEKEGDKAGKKCSEGQKQVLKLASLEPMQMKQQRSTRSYDGKPSPNPDTIDTDKTGMSFEGQQLDVKLESSEPTQLERQPYTNSFANELSPHLDSLQIERCEIRNGNQCSTRSYDGKPSPNPDAIDTDKTGKSFEGQQLDVKLESSEPMQLERQPHTNSCANELSPDLDSLQTERCETRNGNQGQNWDVEYMELEPQPSISSHANKPSSNTSSSMVEKDKTGKDSYQGKNGDPNFESVKAAMMEPGPRIISNAIANKSSLNQVNTETEMAKTGNISFEGQNQCCSFGSVEFMEMEQQPSITIHVNKLSPNPDIMVLEKDKIEKINSEGRNDLDFRSVESMLESRPSISSDSHKSSQAPDKTKIERDLSGKVSSHPEQMVGDRRACRRRPGLGLVYNIRPFTIIQKYEKAKQVVSVDFTILDHISDPDAFTKKAYELEAAVAEIQRLGGEPNIIGERVFKAVEDDQPRRRRPGLGLQMQRPKFVPLPMRPLPVKVQCACQNRAPTQSTNPPKTTKVNALSGSQNEASSSISHATKEVPEMNVSASGSYQSLFSNLESYPEDEEKAVAMVFDWLNLKPNVIPPLVIPEMPKFSRLHVVTSPWRQLPSIERVRELRGEDPLVAFEELKRKFFARSPGAYYSDDDTNPLTGLDSVRSLSTSPGCQFSFENEEIDTPSHAGPSGSPNVEIEEFPSQEKVPETTSEGRGGNLSDEDDAGDDMPDEPEMGSTWDNSPVNIEVAVSEMPLENLPVNREVPPSAMLLDNPPEEEVVIEEGSSRKSKKRGLEHADSSLDMHFEIPTPMSDSNTMAQVETSLVEPPGKRDEQMAPPKKRNKKQQKRESNIQIVEGGLEEVGGLRRSTRIRSRPLRHWMGERFLYARINDKFPGAVGVKECSPATVGIRVKVRSFVSDEHADLIQRIAK